MYGTFNTPNDGNGFRMVDFDILSSVIYQCTCCMQCHSQVDGSWRKRGHSSLQGTVACISTDTGKNIDYEDLNKVCHKCSRFSNTDSVAYPTFISKNTCKTNYEGSAASKEPICIKRIYNYSIEKNNLRYTEYLGDGDSSSLN